MKTKNYLLGALLIPGMMLAASGGVLAAEHGNDDADKDGMERTEQQRSDRAQDGPARAEERRSERAEDGPARAEERRGAAMEGETYLSSKPYDAFHSDELIGTEVKSTAAEDESIGSVRNLIIDESGQIKAVVIGVGGLLGMGQKHIAMDWDALDMTKDDDGDYVIHVNATKEALEGAPEYEKE
jgi:hypothetical protein